MEKTTKVECWAPRCAAVEQRRVKPEKGSPPYNGRKLPYGTVSRRANGEI